MKKTFPVTVRFKTKRQAQRFKAWWRKTGGESLVFDFYRWKTVKLKV